MADDIRIQPKDPDAARAEIERTRARMSETIDEIEDALLRKKVELRERLDIGARIRERPLQTAGAVLCAGVLLGFLTGGARAPAVVVESDRSALWEKRARRLLAIARAQETDIEELEAVVAGLALAEAESMSGADYEIEDLASRVRDLGEALRERSAELFSALGIRVIEAIRSRL
jgi:hypothetical protein